jgi:hypothetical protein
LVNVRKKKNIQTSTCRPSAELSGHALNKREDSTSVHGSKTLPNSSRESRSQQPALTVVGSHNGTHWPKHSACEQSQDFVFVIGENGEALMPTKSGKARRLLKAGLAKVVRKTPFVIKMLVPTCEYKQPLDAGMDTGSKVIGVAVRRGAEPIYMSEVYLRAEEIKRKLEQRQMYRRNRRGRKTRYRKARFLNRGASIAKGRLAPSTRHVADAHLRERDFVHSILPASHVRWTLELASFDIHKITNPDVVDYQKGRQVGFLNIKAYVLYRDHHTCQKCKAQNTELHVHHIVFRSNGGTDSPDNLVVLCGSCHKKLHDHPKTEKESLKLQSKQQKNTKDATKVSIVASQLRKHFGNFTETFGYETKEKRAILGFPKHHRIDALLASCSPGEIVNLKIAYFKKRCVSQGDYQQTSGARSEKQIPTGKLFGLRKFDLISTTNGTGFVKGKRSSGYFAISEIDGKKIHDSVNVKKTVVRLSARKTVLVQKLGDGALLPALKNGVSAREVR